MEFLKEMINIRIDGLEYIINEDAGRLDFYRKKRNAIAIEEGELVAQSLDFTIGKIEGVMYGRMQEIEDLKEILEQIEKEAD